MPLKNYSLLKGTIVDSQQATSGSPHYQIKVQDGTTDYRIAVNVKSDLNPPNLEFIMFPDFQHPLTDAIAEMSVGMHLLPADPLKRRDSGVSRLPAHESLHARGHDNHSVVRTGAG
jgi:uncharacterized protein YukJ